MAFERAVYEPIDMQHPTGEEGKHSQGIFPGKEKGNKGRKHHIRATNVTSKQQAKSPGSRRGWGQKEQHTSALRKEKETRK